MSHAYGRVLKDGEVIGHFEYNGTVDIATTKIQPTREAVSENWRDIEATDQTCCCYSRLVAVDIEVDYGDGLEWEALMCPECRTLIGPLDKWGHFWNLPDHS